MIIATLAITHLKDYMNNKSVLLSTLLFLVAVLAGCSDDHRPVQVVQPAPQIVQQAPQVIGYDSAGQPVYGNPQVVQQAAYPGQPTTVVVHDNHDSALTGFVAGAVVGNMLSNSGNNNGYDRGRQTTNTTIVNKTVVVNNHAAPVAHVAVVPTPARPNYALVATPIIPVAAPKPATTSMLIPAPKPVAGPAPTSTQSTSSFTSRPSTRK
jgi:hypothetical protein